MIKNSTYSFNNTKGSLKFRSFAIFILFVILFPMRQSFAQQVVERDNYIAQLQASESANLTQLETFLFDIQPTLYFTAGTFTPKGEGQMKVVNIGVKDLNKLLDANDLFSSISLLTVKILDDNELDIFDLQPYHLANLPNLNYVFLSIDTQASFETIKSKLSRFSDADIIFLYKSSRPF